MISSVIHVTLLLFWLLAMSTVVRSAQAQGSLDDVSYATTPSFPIEDSTPQIRRLWIVHGVLMMVGFSLFIPIAICGSLIRNFLPGAMWYRIHRVLNWAAVFVITISFCIAGYIVSMDCSLWAALPCRSASHYRSDWISRVLFTRNKSLETFPTLPSRTYTEQRD